MNAEEKHYSPIEVAELWGISRQTVIRFFQDHPGVLKLAAPRISSRRKPRTMLRIPASVLRDFHGENASQGFTAELQGRRRRR